MATFSFRAILKDHSDSPEQIADKLYPLYDDITASSSEDNVEVAFNRVAPTFSQSVRSAHKQLTAAGYEIDRIEIDGQDLPLLGQIADSDFYVADDDDTHAD